MRSPFRKGQRVCLANDMVLLRGTVSDPCFQFESYHRVKAWAVCILVPPQADFEHFIKDIGCYECVIDVTHSRGVFRGYTGPSLRYEPDGSMDILVLPDH